MRESPWKRLSLLTGVSVGGISPHALRECSEALEMPFQILLRSCMEEVSVPRKWKRTNVVSISKNDDC